MADDKNAEQIGLAVSDDGLSFQRVPPDGLVLRRDPTVPWRSLRVCNPTVLERDGGFVMFFQGIAESLNVSIGRATSPDGTAWTCDPEPCLAWEEMREHAGPQEPGQRTAVIEPAVLFEDGRYRMWFVYLGSGHESHSLFYAESETGERWEIRSEPLLRGSSFGFCLLHYPHVRRLDDEYELYVTLRSRRSQIDAIYRLRSADGLAWSESEKVAGRWELGLARNGTGVGGKVAGRLVRPLNRLLERGPYRGAELGLGHAHVIDNGDGQLLFWQRNARGRRGRDLAIGVSRLTERGTVAPRIVLEASPDPAAWDAFFVADGFVVPVSDG
jgi:hypothetical protein